MAESFDGGVHGGLADFSHMSFDEIAQIVDSDYANLSKLRNAADGARGLRDLLDNQHSVTMSDYETLRENYRSPSSDLVLTEQFDKVSQSVSHMKTVADQHASALDTMADEVERVKPIIDGLKAEREEVERIHRSDPHAFDILASADSPVDGVTQANLDIVNEARGELSKADAVYQTAQFTKMETPVPFDGPTWSGQKPINALGSGYDPSLYDNGSGYSSADSGELDTGLPSDSGPTLQNPGVTNPPAITPSPTPGVGSPPPTAGGLVPPGVNPGMPPVSGTPPVTPPAARSNPSIPTRPAQGTPSPGRSPNTGTPRPGGSNARGNAPSSSRPVSGRGNTGARSTSSTGNRGGNASSRGSQVGRGAVGRNGKPVSPRRSVIGGSRNGKPGRSNESPRSRVKSATGMDQTLSKGINDRATRGIIRGAMRDLPGSEIKQVSMPRRSSERVIGARRNKSTGRISKPLSRTGSLTRRGVVASGVKTEDKTWVRSKPTQSTEPSKGSVLLGRRASADAQQNAKTARMEARAKRRQQRRDILAGKKPQQESFTGQWFNGMSERTVPGVIGGRTETDQVTRRDAGRVFGGSGWEG